MTIIECSECGGHYYAGRDIFTGDDIFAVCDNCGHEMAAEDFTLEADEVLAWDAQGYLCYVSAGE